MREHERRQKILIVDDSEINRSILESGKSVLLM